MELDRHEPELVGTIGEFGKECVGKITSSVAKGVYDAILKSKESRIKNLSVEKDEKIHCEVIH